MSNKNGLLAPTATHGALSPSYYLSRNEPIITPTLVAPIAVESFDREATAQIAVTGFTAGAPATYTGAISLNPGSSSVGSAPAGITVRAINNGCAVDIGADGYGANTLYISGPSGSSQVYDQKYNQVIKSTAVAFRSSSLPDTTGFTYTPDVSGAYMLQVDINIRNADVIPTVGFIEWVLTDAAGEIQFSANTVNGTSLIKVLGMNDINGVAGGISEPTDFTTSDLCFLQAGVPVTFSIFTARNSLGGGGQWAINNYQARLIKMC